MRLIRHFNWLEERQYQANNLLAACGWTSRMSGLEQRLYIAFVVLNYCRMNIRSGSIQALVTAAFVTTTVLSAT
jgi:hypothetical protein